MLSLFNRNNRMHQNSLLDKCALKSCITSVIYGPMAGFLHKDSHTARSRHRDFVSWCVDTQVLCSVFYCMTMVSSSRFSIWSTHDVVRHAVRIIFKLRCLILRHHSCYTSRNSTCALLLNVTFIFDTLRSSLVYVVAQELNRGIQNCFKII